MSEKQTSLDGFFHKVKPPKKATNGRNPKKAAAPRTPPPETDGQDEESPRKRRKVQDSPEASDVIVLDDSEDGSNEGGEEASEEDEVVPSAQPTSQRSRPASKPAEDAHDTMDTENVDDTPAPSRQPSGDWVTTAKRRPEKSNKPAAAEKVDQYADEEDEFEHLFSQGDEPTQWTKPKPRAKAAAAPQRPKAATGSINRESAEEEEESLINPKLAKLRVVTPTRDNHRAKIITSMDEDEDEPNYIKKEPRVDEKPAVPLPPVPDGFIDITTSLSSFASAKQTLLQESHQKVFWGVLFTDTISNTRTTTELKGNRGTNAKGICLMLEKGRLTKLYLPLHLPQSHAVTLLKSSRNAAPHAGLVAPARVAKAETGAGEEATQSEVVVTEDDRFALLQAFLESETIEAKICFDAKNCLKPMLHYNYHVAVRNVVDIQVGAWMVDSDLFSNDSSLESVCRYFLRDEKVLTRLMAFGKVYTTMLPDLLVIGRLLVRVTEELQQNDLWDAFISREMPVVQCVTRMEMEGFTFNNDDIIAAKKKMTDRLVELQALADRACNKHIRLSSIVEIRKYLFDELKLKPPSTKLGTTRGGGLSTDENTLRAISKAHPLPNLVLEFRQLEKTKANWVDSFDKHKELGRLYSTWRQVGTSTGRLSSSDPNFQNLRRVPLEFLTPDRDDPSKRVRVSIDIRSAFTAGPGMALIAADYSQLEMRLLASIANEETLITFFSQEKDIHRMVASHWKKKPANEITSEERNQAKRLVYAITYGMGVRSLAETLGVNQKVAGEFHREFLAAYPAIQQWISRTIAQSHRDKLVKTLYGRRRLLRSDHEDNKADRQAVNTVIQGTAADIVKIAMIKVDKEMRGKPCHLRLNVHDELVYEVPIDLVDGAVAVIKRCMESAPGNKLTVPLPVEVEVGAAWGRLTRYHPKDAPKEESTAAGPSAAATASTAPTRDIVEVGSDDENPEFNEAHPISDEEPLPHDGDDDLFS